ncbi:conserved hypothetical protein [Ricinus communis]|uniref:Uncharacterized protein n=1 Tax=Ricinus communis TaxID=3988 RepID=B9T9P3_RICCO|nr:conserved hypothetical protein [Ricinus communis]
MLLPLPLAALFCGALVAFSTADSSTRSTGYDIGSDEFIETGSTAGWQFPSPPPYAMKEPLNHPVMRIAGAGSSGKASVINWGMKAILPVEKNYPMLTYENFFISFYESEVTNHHSELTHNILIISLQQAMSITTSH